MKRGVQGSRLSLRRPTFCRQLERLGFEPSVPVTEGPFIRIRTQKNGKKADPAAVVAFRSAALAG